MVGRDVVLKVISTAHSFLRLVTPEKAHLATVGTVRVGKDKSVRKERI